MTSITEEAAVLATFASNSPGAAGSNHSAGPRIGPAKVVEIDGPRLAVEFEGSRLRPVMALAYQYRPVVDDLLLIAGGPQGWYVIGVLKGRGRTLLDAPGDLSIRAPRGNIELVAGRGVTIHAPSIRLAAKRLETAARTVTQRFGRLTQRITRELDLQAGRMRSRITGSYRLRAESIVEKADQDVKLDGRQVRLG